MHHTLEICTATTADVLRERLHAAVAASASPAERHSRGDFPETDDFLASASRHVAAVSSALLPEARRRLDDGRLRVRAHVQQSRELEIALARVKGRLYGAAQMLHVTWHDLWRDVEVQLERSLELERDLVEDLVRTVGDERADVLAARVCHAEQHGPTRPHPFAPHVGVRGRAARRVLRTVDSFWDTTEGRMLPEPVVPRDHSHDGLLTHYLLADTDPDPGPAAAAGPRASDTR